MIEGIFVFFIAFLIVALHTSSSREVPDSNTLGERKNLFAGTGVYYGINNNGTIPGGNYGGLAGAGAGDVGTGLGGFGTLPGGLPGFGAVGLGDLGGAGGGGAGGLGGGGAGCGGALPNS